MPLLCPPRALLHSPSSSRDKLFSFRPYSRIRSTSLLCIVQGYRDVRAICHICCRALKVRLLIIGLERCHSAACAVLSALVNSTPFSRPVFTEQRRESEAAITLTLEVQNKVWGVSRYLAATTGKCQMHSADPGDLLSGLEHVNASLSLL